MKNIFVLFLLFLTIHLSAQTFTDISIESDITDVQPMTGIVFWVGDNTNTDAIALEYSYMLYNDVVKEKGVYDWTVVDNLLADVASRKHQAILRFRFTYVGYQTAVPDYIKNLSDYEETEGISEGETTWFPDWTHQELIDFTLDFYTKFAERYDNDPRIAFLQTGFGLWAEYHIYEGPFVLGKTFPSKAYQETFYNHLGNAFDELSWSISIDARDEDYSPLEANQDLLNIDFGNFDDSFMSEEHPTYNALNWNFFGASRYLTNPAGGEFSYYTNWDQKHVLDYPNGSHGISYEQSAKDWQISYMIGNDQPGYQTMDRIKEASLATGYKFQVTSVKTIADSAIINIKNIGAASFYFDAYPAINGVKATETLKYLGPGETRTFHVGAGGAEPTLTIECEHLVSGQKIGYFGTTYVPDAVTKVESLQAKVYPTLVKKGTSISIELETNQAELYWFTLAGKLIEHHAINSKSNFAPKQNFPGMYLLEIRAGNKVFTQKIVID